MNEDELQSRVGEFGKTLLSAQERAGMPSLIVYAFFGGEAGVLGGELVASPGEGDERTAVLTALTTVSLLGYLQARLDVLKHESSAMYGPEFTLMLHREVAGQVEGMSATGTTALQQAVVDMAVALRPCFVLAAQPGSPAAEGHVRGDAMAHMTTGTRPLKDLVPVFAVLKRYLEDTIEHSAKSVGMDVAKLNAVIDDMKQRLTGGAGQ